MSVVIYSSAYRSTIRSSTGSHISPEAQVEDYFNIFELTEFVTSVVEGIKSIPVEAAENQSRSHVAFLKTQAVQGLPIANRVRAQRQLLKMGRWSDEDMAKRINFLIRKVEDKETSEEDRNNYLDELALNGVKRESE